MSGKAQLFLSGEAKDDAETPLEAYSHVSEILRLFASNMKKKPSKLRLWDPFYCKGTMRAHLKSLGFHRVYNKAEDAWSVIQDQREPEFDVLLSNPPFSGENIPRLLHYCQTRVRTPWLLLLPHYVARKAAFLEYIKSLREAGSNLPLYVGPRDKAYVFCFCRDDSLSRIALNAYFLL